MPLFLSLFPDIFLFLFYRFYSCFINWFDRFLNIVAVVWCFEFYFATETSVHPTFSNTHVRWRTVRKPVNICFDFFITFEAFYFCYFFVIKSNLFIFKYSRDILILIVMKLFYLLCFILLEQCRDQNCIIGLYFWLSSLS